MDVVVRELDGTAELTAAARLYRAVFGYDQPEYGVSPRLLAALRENSGSVIGALDRTGTMIGFCYGFSAVDGGELYHYSQAAVVAADAQGLGVGRRLKHAQAQVARGTGARTMRWTFDPYAVRNAHFNLNVLGATGVRFLPDYYGGGTDRVLVSWDLWHARKPGAPAGAVSSPATDRHRLRAGLEERFAAGARWTAVTRDADRVTCTFENDRS
ncbi:Predicted acetyltransferase, GNAT superfamily [Actinoplanes philippinensis]|uniref:Predicted acetyltransferase, GNAT superfamily n=1 Tax=Actinoplanes philippinensis TaxID=35752 RepID=A0A1I1ZLE8_9ACTN|nr:GNAT family N-acetyltransferase [Actinoplanes philippinensis]SFE32531.1 Predicted acetyltransferase, GNAT superfamily [Actinoplanes philippinensis]